MSLTIIIYTIKKNINISSFFSVKSCIALQARSYFRISFIKDNSGFKLTRLNLFIFFLNCILIYYYVPTYYSITLTYRLIQSTCPLNHVTASIVPLLILHFHFSFISYGMYTPAKESRIETQHHC